MLILRQLNVTGDFKRKLKIYAAQRDLTMQELAKQALDKLLKTKTIEHYFAARLKTAPVLLMVRVPEASVKRANTRATKDHVTFPDLFYTALVRLLEGE